MTCSGWQVPAGGTVSTPVARIDAAALFAGTGPAAGGAGEGPAAYLLFQKWLRHDPGDPSRDDARDWLTGLLANTEMGTRLFDGQHGRMMRAIRLSRLSRFPGAPFSQATLEAAVKRFS